MEEKLHTLKRLLIYKLLSVARYSESETEDEEFSCELLQPLPMRIHKQQLTI
ncbi:hypothetical protein J6590_037344 [Homalodisca vitripennis]|nr:hypothetical protein J6590_037344 [Homalodisca vitripennis]